MKLELSLENTSNSWPLTPDQAYIAGSDTTCDLTLPVSENLRPQHLKFAFDRSNNCWMVEDLSGRRGTIVNNALVAIALLKGVSRIVISDSVVIIATPEFATAPLAQAPAAPVPSVAPTLVAPSNQSPSNYVQPNVYTPPNPNVYNSGYAQPLNTNNAVAPATRNPISSGISNVPVEELRVLSWQQYVKKQRSEHGSKSFAMSWIVNFAMKTGFRNTPWMNEIDGYILPNFKGSAEEVAASVERELGMLRQYEETDCYVSSLTDAHIVNSAAPSFQGIEFFPIIRSRNHNRGDYRRFCITSYHRVKSYLLVERYGPDLFVIWLTRFEPMPSPVMMIFLLILSSLFFLGLISTSFIVAILPLVLWWNFYHFNPFIMTSLNILPKAANARLVSSVVFVITLIGLLGGLVSFSWTFLVLLIAAILSFFMYAVSSGQSNVM